MIRDWTLQPAPHSSFLGLPQARNGGSNGPEAHGLTIFAHDLTAGGEDAFDQDSGPGVVDLAHE
jgi:hypothetical protein